MVNDKGYKERKDHPCELLRLCPYSIGITDGKVLRKPVLPHVIKVDALPVPASTVRAESERETPFVT